MRPTRLQPCGGPRLPSGVTRGGRLGPGGGRPPALTGLLALLGLLVYLLPLSALVPRPALGGVGDRAAGLVFARHRQALFDPVVDERPLPRPAPPLLGSGCPPGTAGPAPAGCVGAERAAPRLAPRPAAPGRPRSPPVR